MVFLWFSHDAGGPRPTEVQSHGLQNGAVLSVFDQHPTDAPGETEPWESMFLIFFYREINAFYGLENIQVSELF